MSGVSLAVDIAAVLTSIVPPLVLVGGFRCSARRTLRHSNNPVSLYMAVGNTVQVKALFVLQGAVVAVFILGFQTRLATVCAWFMHMSLHARCPVLQNKGEELSVRLMLWATVLPLGARWYGGISVISGISWSYDTHVDNIFGEYFGITDHRRNQILIF